MSSSDSSSDNELASPVVVAEPASANSSLAPPAGHELKPTNTSSTMNSINSTRELKPKREKDWRETFSPAESEELIETHGCALAKDVLVHGRIFVSKEKIYFKSNILGFKTLVDFPLSSVVSIEPKMTALVIPNAIEIVVQSGETYLFTTLNARDEFLDILLALWRMASPDNFSSFIAKKDAGEAADYRARASSVSSAPHADAVKTYHVETTSSAGEHVEYESTQQVKDTPAGTKTAVSAKIETKGHPETQAEGVEDFEEVCMDITFPCEPKKIFDLWYRDESFVDDLWNKLEFTEIDCSPLSEGQKTREYSYIKPLKGSFGPSSTKCVFHDEITNEDPDKFYAILTVTQTPNVPSGKTFKCKSMTTFTWAGENRGCRVRATSEVEFSGRSMIKGVINKSSIAGQKEYNEALENETREYLKTHKEMLLEGVDDSAPVKPPKPKETGKVSMSSKSGSKESESLLDTFLDDPIKLILVSVILVLLLSNTYLFFTRSSNKSISRREFRGAKHEVKGAMERLDRMEREWEGVRRHFSSEDAVAPVVVRDTAPVVQDRRI